MLQRHRYGKDHCDAERLPADQLEAVVLDTLLMVFSDTELIARAVKAVTDCRDDQDQHLRDELDTIAKELGTTEEAIDRYLTAFETGGLPQSLCAPRVQGLAEKAAQLKERRGELQELLARDDRVTPDEEELGQLTSEVRAAIDSGNPAVIKTMLEPLIHDIAVEGRQHVVPTFRLPPPAETHDDGPKVRAMHGSAPPAGRNTDGNGRDQRFSGAGITIEATYGLS